MQLEIYVLYARRRCTCPSYYAASIYSVKTVFQNGSREREPALYAERWLDRLIFNHMGMDQP
ncbi:UNVERIFIED_CONTAM: hypothetical protein Sindi_2090400, partial [Sesamum indicum]